MLKYLLNRLLRGLVSVIIVVAIVMILVYSLMDRTLIFSSDPLYSKQMNNAKITYQYSRWEQYGYVDYVTYADYLTMLVENGEITEDIKANVISIGRTADKDTKEVSKYVDKFYEYYQSQGYEVTRLDVVTLNKKVATGGQQQLFAFRDHPVFKRLGNFLAGIFTIDNIHKAESVEGKRGLTFTLHDPIYGGKFAPAIIGNGTINRYLLYFDNQFPYLHQNFIKVSLGTSYTVNKGVDVVETMSKTQGGYDNRMVTYPSGLVEYSADDLHTAKYSYGSRTATVVNEARYIDDYTNVNLFKQNKSKVGFSFVIGIISTIISYVLGLPLGVICAKNKDKLIDKLGTIYVVFIIAVPSLAYIFMFKGIGGLLNLPTTFIMSTENWKMYILPITSLALPSVAGLMKWMRRYMIDQMNSDYVKFARSGGLTDSEIFSKHISKNALIPIAHGIPGSILGSITGALITERVYAVPGAGGLFTNAINKYDNGVIIGLTMFFTLLSVVSIVLGDIVMALVDPRISFEDKAR